MDERQIRAAALAAAATYIASPIVSAAGARLAEMTSGRDSFATPDGVIAVASLFEEFIRDGVPKR